MRRALDLLHVGVLLREEVEPRGVEGGEDEDERRAPRVLGDRRVRVHKVVEEGERHRARGEIGGGEDGQQSPEGHSEGGDVIRVHAELGAEVEPVEIEPEERAHQPEVQQRRHHHRAVLQRHTRALLVVRHFEPMQPFGDRDEDCAVKVEDEVGTRGEGGDEDECVPAVVAEHHQRHAHDGEVEAPRWHEPHHPECHGVSASVGDRTHGLWADHRAREHDRRERKLLRDGLTERRRRRARHVRRDRSHVDAHR
mmetsp:Transcript_34071/g.89582  ORF Transcript_34071/g.89582 Transcript_34071/m.89582 type:complete len:253 (-) Transcript_34071:352-1110(-)